MHSVPDTDSITFTHIQSQITITYTSYYTHNHRHTYLPHYTQNYTCNHIEHMPHHIIECHCEAIKMKSALPSNSEVPHNHGTLPKHSDGCGLFWVLASLFQFSGVSFLELFCKLRTSSLWLDTLYSNSTVTSGKRWELKFFSTNSDF